MSESFLNIVLIGFMGCGKSSLGKVLAKEIGFDFIDSDLEIAKSENMAIADIFKTKGEDYFRQLEKNFILNAKNLNHYVIATGGGMPIYADIREMGFSIFLDSSFEVISHRLRSDRNRPLFDTQAHERFITRHPIYTKNADLIIPANGTIKETLKLILEKIK